LSVPQIEKGQAVLAEIKKQLAGKSNAGVLNQLSSQFYSLIPTKFGRKIPEPINNQDMLQSKESLLEFWLRMVRMCVVFV
jgi:hypothetical protein